MAGTGWERCCHLHAKRRGDRPGVASLRHVTLRHEPDISQASWFAARAEPWTQLCSIGRSGFERYARLFHPVSPGTDATNQEELADLEGDLPQAELRLLTTVLARHTSTPEDCFFALWDGYGELRGGAAVGFLQLSRSRGLRGAGTPPAITPAFSPEVMSAPRVQIPARSYLLFRGVLDDAGTWGAADVLPGRPRRINSPNLMWPSDHAWFVASEIDLPWTGIGGTAALLDDLLSTEGLDVQATELSDRLPYWRT